MARLTKFVIDESSNVLLASTGNDVELLLDELASSHAERTAQATRRFLGHLSLIGKVTDER
jgi:hypothetical protein